MLRNHAMQGALSKLQNSGVSVDAIKGLKDAVDLNLYFFDNQVGLPIMAIIVVVSVIFFLGLYVALNVWANKKK